MRKEGRVKTVIRISQVKDDVATCAGCGKIYGIYFMAEMANAEGRFRLNLCKACLGKMVRAGDDQLRARREEIKAERKAAAQNAFIKDGYLKNRGPDRGGKA